jgi:hypothetical protein
VAFQHFPTSLRTFLDFFSPLLANGARNREMPMHTFRESGRGELMTINGLPDFYREFACLDFYAYFLFI